MSAWHFITGEYPPTIGGVSDYAFTMAAALGATSPVEVWCPAVAQAAPSAPNVTVHPILRSFSPGELRRLAQELDRHAAPRQLFVQWTPQSFGYRSLNVGFARWLAARAGRAGDVLHLMVHEPFLSWSFRPAHLVAAAVHRTMLGLAARRATHVWVSTSTWQPLIRPFVPARTPIGWLPLPAPAIPAVPPIVERSHHTSLIGHFGTHSPLVTPMLARALDVVLEKTSARVLLVGRDSEAFRTRFVEQRPAAAARVEATGVLRSEGIAPALRQCDLMLQPYPDGVTTRRTSTLTLLSLGLPVVTNLGHLSEDFWQAAGALALAPVPDGRAIGETAAALLADDGRRAMVAAQGHALYEARFAIGHAVALLNGAVRWDRHAA